MIRAASSAETGAASQSDVTDRHDDKTKETHFKRHLGNMPLTDGAVNFPQMISRAQICGSSESRIPFVCVCFCLLRDVMPTAIYLPSPLSLSSAQLVQAGAFIMSYTPADISQKLHQHRLKSHSDVAAVDGESEPSRLMSAGERGMSGSPPLCCN